MVTQSKYVYTNQWIKVREDKFVREGRELTYSVVERSDSVVLIPLSENLKTILLHQWRHPTQALSDELSMGGIDEGETPEAAALREFREETGLSGGKLEHIGAFQPVPGLTPQQVHVFVVRLSDQELLQAKVDNSHGDDIDHLQILNLTQVFRLVAEGKITDGFTLSSLLLLRLYLDR